MSQIKKLWFFHEQLDELEPIEFENLIFDIVRAKFSDSEVEKITGGKDLGFDIKGIENEVEFLIEVKKRRLVGADEIHKLGYLWKSYNVSDNSNIILAVSGTLTSEAIEEAKNFNIEIWDVYKLYGLVSKDLQEKYFYKDTPTVKTETKEEIYIKNLNEITAGGDDWQKEWSKYQKLVSDILEHLFCPILESPRFEHSDLDNKNRRDIIFENSAEEGLWKHIRSKYIGDYIVVDAKNYKEPIKKRSIIELAHYLKPYGCGLFGIVISRKEESETAFHARKEQWIGNKKMIISLQDEDLIEMLKIKKKGGKPEELIRMKIADFRMKL